MCLHVFLHNTITHYAVMIVVFARVGVISCLANCDVIYDIVIMEIQRIYYNNNNVHLSCAHQRPERSQDT